MLISNNEAKRKTLEIPRATDIFVSRFVNRQVIMVDEPEGQTQRAFRETH